MQLTDLEWEKRSLLIFAHDHQDKRLVHTLRVIQQVNCQIEDRDIALLIIVTQERRNLDKEGISTQYATALRSHYDIKDNEFAVLLIGKDGSEKFRTNTIPDIDEIFTLIDGMPMRQDEMLDDQTNCNKPST